MEVREVLRTTVAMVLAGGQGERLYPLTKDRAKPAVPFGGSYRLVDFTLSNCINSGLRKIYVITQYKSDSLNRHIRRGWNILNPELGEYVETLPPQQRMSSDWYLGTAHAIYQNLHVLNHERPSNVLVLSGDHIYRMDYAPMLIQHVQRDADLTVACMQVPIKRAAGRLGVMTVDEDSRAVAFEEKPVEPVPEHGSADTCLCSMGIYVFKIEPLVRRLIENVKEGHQHDFGRDVLPHMIERGDSVFAYPFPRGYWRDVGTLDAYWRAHMDLVSVQPAFNLYDQEWPIRGFSECRPPAKTVLGGGGDTPKAEVYNSLISNGSIVSGAYVCDSVLGADVRVEVGSRIEQSVILDGVRVGSHAVIQKAIIDKNVVIPDNARVGVDAEWDARHFSISEGGVVVIPKNLPFPNF